MKRLMKILGLTLTALLMSVLIPLNIVSAKSTVQTDYVSVSAESMYGYWDEEQCVHYTVYLGATKVIKKVGIDTFNAQVSGTVSAYDTCLQQPAVQETFSLTDGHITLLKQHGIKK